MDTQCNDAQLDFQPFGRRLVTGRHDGGHMSSDGGGLLLREVDGRIDLTRRLAGCFEDHRNAASAGRAARACPGVGLRGSQRPRRAAARCGAVAAGRPDGPDRRGRGTATSGSWRVPRPWTICWSSCSWSPASSRRGNSGWTWTRRTIHCTVPRRVASSTATTAATATCRCTYSAFQRQSEPSLRPVTSHRQHSFHTVTVCLHAYAFRRSAGRTYRVVARLRQLPFEPTQCASDRSGQSRTHSPCRSKRVSGR